MSDILIRPLISEKTTLMSQNPKLNKYGFVVDRKANKLEIKKAVEKMYGVQVVDVNTSIRPGKMKMRQTTKGVTKGVKGRYKKAYVTLNGGESIDFYAGV